MADGVTELAMLFKERENKPSISFVKGTVRSAAPIVIEPEGISFSLGTDDLIIPERLTEHEEEVKINGQTVAILHEGLKVHERVVLLPSADGQLYYVIDRVVI
jgi:hypothetical protein